LADRRIGAEAILRQFSDAGAVTAFAGDFPEAMTREAGFDFYLDKPADASIVETLIRDRTRPAAGADPGTPL